MSKRVEMTVKMQVTPAQGLALQAMFNRYNLLSSIGSSSEVAFFADGDGNFHPKAEIEFSKEIPTLTKELEEKATRGDCTHPIFDPDPVAWSLLGESVGLEK